MIAKVSGVLNCNYYRHEIKFLQPGGILYGSTSQNAPPQTEREVSYYSWPTDNARLGKSTVSVLEGGVVPSNALPQIPDVRQSLGLLWRSKCQDSRSPSASVHRLPIDRVSHGETAACSVASSSVSLRAVTHADSRRPYYSLRAHSSYCNFKFTNPWFRSLADT